MKKSPIDELFFEIYGYYPPKAGQAYELIVGAAFKLLFGNEVKYDERVRGKYSDTVYQLDGQINEAFNSSMVEVKDYTIDEKKVGRGDLQKLQGALTDLDVSKGIFASATDFSTPAKKYADSTIENPMQKQIDLFHIRQSTEEDEEGRIKKIVINISMHSPDYKNGKYNFCWTDEGCAMIEKNELVGKEITMDVDRFYDYNGNILTTLSEITKLNQPMTTFEEGYIAKATWVLKNAYWKYDQQLYGIKGVTYAIPFTCSKNEIIIEGGGEPKIYFKSQNGEIDTLITDEQLKKVRFEDGRVQIE